MQHTNNYRFDCEFMLKYYSNLNQSPKQFSVRLTSLEYDSKSVAKGRAGVQLVCIS